MWSNYRLARRAGFSVLESLAFALFRESSEEMTIHTGKLRALDELEQFYQKESARRAIKN